MLIFSVALLGIAALAGVYMMARMRKSAMPPWQTAIVHGLSAAIGLSFLLYLVFVAETQQSQVVKNAVNILLAAALVGLVLLSFRLRKRAYHAVIVLGHAMLAISGFLTLAIAAFV